MSEETDKTVLAEGVARSQPLAAIRGDTIAEVSGLAMAAAARVQIVPIPQEALPDAALLGEPHFGVIVSKEGRPEIVDLKSKIDAYRTKPAFREGTATALTLESFMELVNRHANTDTAIFLDANWKAPKLTAVIDYHAVAATPASDGPPNDRKPSEDGEDALARFGKHRIAYAFPLSEAWKVWVKYDGEYMAQAEFAEFLEDHIHELGSPTGSAEEAEWEKRFKSEIADPADIINLSRGLDVKVGATVKNRTKLSSGETQFVFETTHTDNEGKELTVPGLFLLSIPIFYRGEQQRILVRLRYRLQGGAILWAYMLHRPDEAVDATVRADADQVFFTTNLPVYDGHPEAKPGC